MEFSSGVKTLGPLGQNVGKKLSSGWEGAVKGAFGLFKFSIYSLFNGEPFGAT